MSAKKKIAYHEMVCSYVGCRAEELVGYEVVANRELRSGMHDDTVLVFAPQFQDPDNQDAIQYIMQGLQATMPSATLSYERYGVIGSPRSEEMVLRIKGSFATMREDIRTHDPEGHKLLVAGYKQFDKQQRAYSTENLVPFLEGLHISNRRNNYTISGESSHIQGAKLAIERELPKEELIQTGLSIKGNRLYINNPGHALRNALLAVQREQKHALGQ